MGTYSNCGSCVIHTYLLVLIVIGHVHYSPNHFYPESLRNYTLTLLQYMCQRVLVQPELHIYSIKLISPLRQWCGWNSTQHQTWRRALREEFVHASILCWIDLYCFGVRRYIWKRTNNCVSELQTLGGKNSSVYNACNSGLMLGGKFKKIRGMLGGKFEDAGWKLQERVRKR